MSSTKNLRIRLDNLIQNGKAIKSSAETTLAWRSLQMAKAWIGKAMGYRSNATPYPVVQEISAIPPTADVAEVEMLVNPEFRLDSVNLMRQLIQDEIESIEGVVPAEERQKHCYVKCLDHLIEARMWYGFELAEMREKELSPLAPNGDQTGYIPTEQVRVDLEWNKDGKYAVHQEFSDEELEAIVPIMVQPKILENENEDSKKEQSRASKKKG